MILIVACGTACSDAIGVTDSPPRQDLSDVLIPALAALEAGYQVMFATPAGRRPSVESLIDADTACGGDEVLYRRARRFFEGVPAISAFCSLRSALEDGLDRFVGVYLPGIPGCALDLMNNSEAGEILRYFHALKKPTALHSYGTVASLATLPNVSKFCSALAAGETRYAEVSAKGWNYAGYRMAADSSPPDEGSNALGLPFTIVEALGAAGASMVPAPAQQNAHVVVDRELITGQYPVSRGLLAATFVEALYRTNDA